MRQGRWRRWGRSRSCLLEQEDADDLPAVVGVRPVEERAGVEPQAGSQPDVIDVVDGEPGREGPAPASGRSAGQAIAERLDRVEAPAAARRVEVAEDKAIGV